MLKVNITRERKESTPEDLIEVIHNCAKVNGSLKRIALKVDTLGGIYCSEIYANSKYTKGYYAVLFLADSAPNAAAYTFCGNNGNWFYLVINSEEVIIKYLEN